MSKLLIENYHRKLQAIASISPIFSTSDIPFLEYRCVENIFCDTFEAKNLARDDTSYDAVINDEGIGIKTFIMTTDSKLEKVAEFNKLGDALKKLSGIDLAKKLGELRNERIEFADRNYRINYKKYHCITRTHGQIRIFECDYPKINVDNIKLIPGRSTSLRFKDGSNEYNYNYTKSTLFMRFRLPSNYQIVSIKYLDSPLSVIISAFENAYKLTPSSEKPFVILPLYSTKNLFNKKVPKRAQLNQWYAKGRKRDPGEVYIHIPQKIHSLFPSFFPKRDQIFNLLIPTGEIFSAKICQDDSKALMTNPNKALSNWLLRDLLKLKEKELLTYDRLMATGTDCVKIIKESEVNYSIDFADIGTYEAFINSPGIDE